MEVDLDGFSPALSDLTGLDSSDDDAGLPSSVYFFFSDPDRLSVAYQPPPLNITPAG